MGGDIGCCRVIFGESDGFPGLTVDRFSDLLVAQTLSAGMERLKPMLFPIIVETLRADGQKIRGVFERNDVALREREGMEQGKGWFPLEGEALPESPVTEICENGVFYHVDVENGQKTGFFLDQKYNRLAVARLARGKRVLDCFTHTGFEDRTEFIAADVFKLLPELERQGGRPYDFIILDPPAFTKSRKTMDNAERGYKEINYRALKLLPRGGYFATASCSHFMPAANFERMLRSAAADAGVELKQIEARQQAPDHPILWNVPETDYLKFYIFQVV